MEVLGFSPLVLLSVTLLVIWIVAKWMRAHPLAYIPSPPGIPFFGNTFQISSTKPRLTFLQWARQYGGVYRISTIGASNLVILSNYDFIQELLITNGTAFSDRIDFFRLKYTMKDSMLAMKNNDAPCRTLRKLSHRYMKQFGDGMSKLEGILHQAVQRMISDFEATNSSPIDTMETLKEAALYSISVLLLGRAVDRQDPLLKMLMKYESDFTEFLSPVRPGMVLMDKFPWMIHLPLPNSKEMKAFVKLQDDLWQIIKENQRHSEYDSLTKLLLENVVRGDRSTSRMSGDRKSGITDLEAGLTCLNLIFAGIITTSIAMYCMISALACRQDVQDKIHAEVLKVLAVTKKKQVTLAEKSMMPYLRATISEILRQFPPVTVGGLFHVAREDTELKGCGPIPKGTGFLVNTWTLHHEKSFWGDPENFRPERFLNEDGEFLPADHPNRRHVLPFGAGPRVCVGETFAMARLFLWTSALVNKFVIRKGAGVDSDWMNPDKHDDNSVVLKPLPCNVIFNPRD